MKKKFYRNPYFIGINSAIKVRKSDKFCMNYRNPYFIGINSAIFKEEYFNLETIDRNPYFIGINSAIQKELLESNRDILSQSLFYWN